MMKMRPDQWTWDAYFSPQEFADPHSDDPDSGLNMQPEFMGKLFRLRERLGSPVAINPNGGYSSRGHAPNSAHYHGLAADIRCPGVPLDEMSNHIRAVKFKGVGVYPSWRPCAGFHLDMADRRARWVRIDGMYVSLS